MLLIESQYFINIYSLKILCNSSHIGILLCDPFKKMSFQNRCLIPTANGLVNLTVPIVGGRETRQVMGRYGLTIPNPGKRDTGELLLQRIIDPRSLSTIPPGWVPFFKPHQHTFTSGTKGYWIGSCSNSGAGHSSKILPPVQAESARICRFPKLPGRTVHKPTS